jgi:hypothetical protein
MVVELDRRVDELAETLRGHDHDQTERSLEDLRAEDERIRADLDAKLGALDAEAVKAERLNVGGLVLALVGAVLQFLAVFG